MNCWPYQGLLELICPQVAAWAPQGIVLYLGWALASCWESRHSEAAVARVVLVCGGPCSWASEWPASLLVPDKVTDLIYLVFSSFWWGMLSGVYSCVIQKSSYFVPTPKCPATCPFPRPSCLQSSRPFSFSPQTSQLDHWPLLRNVYVVSYVLLSFHNHLQLCSLGRFPLAFPCFSLSFKAVPECDCHAAAVHFCIPPTYQADPSANQAWSLFPLHFHYSELLMPAPDFLVWQNPVHNGKFLIYCHLILMVKHFIQTRAQSYA